MSQEVDKFRNIFSEGGVGFLYLRTIVARRRRPTWPMFDPYGTAAVQSLAYGN